MWFGTAMGWSQWKDGLVTSPRWGRAMRTSAIAEDPSGNLWFSTPFELARVRENRIETFKTGAFADHPIRTILADHDGNIWVGTALGGLCRFRGGSCSDFTTKDGLGHDWVGNLYEDRAGAIWIATLGGVSRFKNGRITSWRVRDGLASNRVACFHEDRAGSSWIGTEGGGLSRFKDGRFANITVENGLYDNLAFQILEDDQQNLWMSCNRGIYRVSLKELNDFADGRIQMVTSYSYGVADGMLSRECNGAAPAGWTSRDGRMWFGTIKGAVAIDPRTVRASRPPKVGIEQVAIDRRIVEAGQPVRVQPGEDNVEIKYTGLSWNRPAHIQFKVQLAGLAGDWVERSTRRSSYYSHVPPGRYMFRVIADNGDGVWNTEGARVGVSFLPPFYSTWW